MADENREIVLKKVKLGKLRLICVGVTRLGVAPSEFLEGALYKFLNE